MCWLSMTTHKTAKDNYEYNLVIYTLLDMIRLTLWVQSFHVATQPHVCT